MIDTQPFEVYQPQHANNSETAQAFVSKGYCAAKRNIKLVRSTWLLFEEESRSSPFLLECAFALAAIYDLTIAREPLPQSEVQRVSLHGAKAHIDQNFQ